MSLITFELKEEHIKLLTNFRWDLKAGSETFKLNFVDAETNALINPYEEVDLILNGKSEFFESEDFNLTDGKIIQKYDPLKLAEWDKLLSELPTALDIILFTRKFETGIYKTKYHVRAWAKSTNGSV